MKRVILSGYYGFNNIGDEAVLASMIQALRNEVPELEITVLSQQPEKTARQYRVHSVNRWRLKEIMPLLKECDLFISGGGSLLQDVTGWKSILYYLGLIQLAKWCHKPVMIYAQGIGPVRRTWAKKLLSWIVNRVDLITVRDPDSGEDLRKMGVNAPPLFVTADPVLGWDAMKETTDFISRLGIEGEKWVGVSLRHWDGINYEEVAAFCDGIVAKGYQVVFLPFHFPGDITTCREAAKLMREESLIIKEELTPAEMMELIGKMHVVVGMRLHALIMSAAQGVPFIAVSYDHKVERFTRQSGQVMACSAQLIESQELTKALEQILTNYSQTVEELREKTMDMKKKARKTAAMAGKLIKGLKGDIDD